MPDPLPAPADPDLGIPASAVPPNARSALSDRRQVLRNAVVIGILVLSAKVFAASREVVIAWRYGVSSIVDAFNISFTVVSWAPQLITSVMVTALVPHLVAARGAKDYRLLVSELNGAVFALALLVLAATMALGPWVAAEIAGGFTASTIGLTREMVLLMSPFGFFLVLSGYLGVRLQARQRFGYTFLEAMPPVFLSVAVIAAGHAAGALPLAYGIVAGGLFQLLILLWLTGRRDGGVGAVRLGFTSPAWTAVYLAIGMIALGQTLNALSIPIDQVVAAKLGTGAVAVIGYSNRLIGLATSLAITVIGYSLLPVLSATAARQEWQQGRGHALRAAQIIFLLAAVAALAAWLLAPWAIALLFERGAFTASDTEAVTRIFRLAALQLPFFAAGIALMQWLAATKRHGLICIVLLAMACGKLLSALILAQHYGLAGIAMSQVVMYAIFFLGMLGFVLVRPQPREEADD